MNPSLPESEHTSGRPEVALTTAGARTGMGRWHAVNPDDPWYSACGHVIESQSAKRADNADFSCQHRACQRILVPRGEQTR